MIDGQYFIQAMGYEPSLALRQNPLEIRRLCEARGLKVSQIDASYPMMGFDGAVYGVQVCAAVQYVLPEKLGCPKVDTTDSGRVYDMSKEDVFKQTILNYQECLKWAEDYKNYNQC